MTTPAPLADSTLGETKISSGRAVLGATKRQQLPVILALLIGSVYLAVDPWGWDSFRPFRWFLVSALAAFAVGTVCRSTVVTDRRPTLLFAGLVVWLMVAAAFGEDPLHAWLGTPDRHLGVLTWLLFLGLFIAAQQLTNLPNVVVALRAVVVGGGMAGLYALLELFGWAVVDVTFANDRLGGPWGQPAYLGAACLLALPVALGLAVGEVQQGNLSRNWRLLSAASAVFCLFAVLASQTRGAWIGLLVAGALGAFAARHHLRAHGSKAVMAAAGLLLLALLVGALTPLGSRASSAFDLGEGTAQGRVDEWRIGVSGLGERPLLGAGSDGYRTVFPALVDDTYEQRYTRQTIPDRAHNVLLDMGLVAGVPGLLLYLALGLFLMSRFVHAVRSQQWWLVGVAVAVVSYLVQQLFLFPLAEVDPVFWILAGVLVIHTSSEAHWQIVRPPLLVPAVVFGAAAVLTLTGVLDVAADHRTQAAVNAQNDGNFTRAREAIDDAITLRPDSIRYRFIASRLASGSSSADGTERALQRVAEGLDLSPKDPAFLTERADLLVQRALDGAGSDASTANFQTATAELQRLLVTDPNNAGYRLQLGILLAATGQTNAADQLAEAARLAPNSVVPELNLALFYLQRGDEQNATQAAQRAQLINPEDPRVQDLIAQIAGP